jgi:hypothetical protein
MAYAFDFLLDSALNEIIHDDFTRFVELFRTKNGKLPKPINNLVRWRDQFQDLIRVEIVADHFELVYDRRKILARLSNKLKFINFERGLRSMKQKLILIQSTHALIHEKRLRLNRSCI